MQRLRHALSALGARLRLLPPYPAAAGLALLAVCYSELLFVPGPTKSAYILLLGAMALPLGVGVGLLWQLILALLMGPRSRLALGLWPLAMTAAGLGLAQRLGAFARLGTRHEEMAHLIIAGSAAGGLALGLVMLGMQPRQPHGRSMLGSRPLWARAVQALLLLAVSSLLTYQDHTLYVGLYLPAHVALRLASAWAGVTALVLLGRELRLPQLGLRSGLLMTVLFLVPVGALQDGDDDTVQAFVTRPWSAMVLRTARGILDLDRDGYSGVLAGGDCNDLNPRIHPAAAEIPGNGIDDNCLFGDRQKLAVAPESVPVPSQDSPMNVVLITVDTLRYDRLGVTNKAFSEGGLNTMPELSTWARRSTHFTRAYSPGSWTSVAVGAMMRGRYARRLAWTQYYETNRYRMLRLPFEGDLQPGERILKMFPLAWQDPHKPLAWWLRRRGMRTVGIVDDGFSQMLSRSLGAGLGYQTYLEIDPRPTQRGQKAAPNDKRFGVVGRGDSGTATAAIRALRFSEGKKPFFMWVHFFGPHTPDRRHPGVRHDGKGVEEGYDHELRYTDKHLGRLLMALNALKGKTAVFVTSDHGEALMKRYRSHGMDLRESIIHVPLFARVPGWSPGRKAYPVSLVDLMPTILGLTGTPAPSGLDGINLTPLVQGKVRPEKRILLSDSWQYRRNGQPYSDMVAAYNGRRKVVMNRLDHSYQAVEQALPEGPPASIEGWAVDDLVRVMMGYVEETGGALKLQN